MQNRCEHCSDKGYIVDGVDIMAKIMYLNELIYILRVIIAGICGIIIGLERKNRLKEAGVRTHCLVACGAALMMILSKYSFFDISPEIGGIRDADPARIAAQVVSGVGFLGAGMIFVHKNTISGLTTAAGIWTTAGIGMAIGAGMYLTGAVVTFIVIIIQIILHMNFKLIKTPSVKVISIYDVDKPDYQKYIEDKLCNNGITVHETSIRKTGKDNKKSYSILIEIPDSINEDEIISMVEYDAVINANA